MAVIADLRLVRQPAKGVPAGRIGKRVDAVILAKGYIELADRQIDRRFRQIAKGDKAPRHRHQIAGEGGVGAGAKAGFRIVQQLRIGGDEGIDACGQVHLHRVDRQFGHMMADLVVRGGLAHQPAEFCRRVRKLPIAQGDHIAADGQVMGQIAVLLRLQQHQVFGVGPLVVIEHLGRIVRRNADQIHGAVAVYGGVFGCGGGGGGWRGAGRRGFGGRRGIALCLRGELGGCRIVAMRANIIEQGRVLRLQPRQAGLNGGVVIGGKGRAGRCRQGHHHRHQRQFRHAHH